MTTPTATTRSTKTTCTTRPSVLPSFLLSFLPAKDNAVGNPETTRAESESEGATARREFLWDSVREMQLSRWLRAGVSEQSTRTRGLLACLSAVVVARGRGLLLVTGRYYPHPRPPISALARRRRHHRYPQRREGAKSLADALDWPNGGVRRLGDGQSRGSSGCPRRPHRRRQHGARTNKNSSRK